MKLVDEVISFMYLVGEVISFTKQSSWNRVGFKRVLHSWEQILLLFNLVEARKRIIYFSYNIFTWVESSSDKGIKENQATSPPLSHMRAVLFPVMPLSGEEVCLPI